VKKPQTCSTPGCSEIAVARTLCQRCYGRLRMARIREGSWTPHSPDGIAERPHFEFMGDEAVLIAQVEEQNADA
jgi:hypothetical protein